MICEMRFLGEFMLKEVLLKRMPENAAITYTQAESNKLSRPTMAMEALPIRTAGFASRTAPHRTAGFANVSG